MHRHRATVLIVVVGLAAGLLLTACGGGAATATPVPPTPTRALPTPTTTAAAPQATPTTASPLATPTPTAAAAPGVPTPVVVTGGKRGGILNTVVQVSYMLFFDTYSAAGRSAVPAHNLFLNNLLWPDPYGDGKTLVGDIAQGWTFSEGGKVITFALNKGIKFHDGNALTSRDVAYNVERAWKPRSPQMTEFKGKLDTLAKVETPDEATLRLTLQRPSNFTLAALSTSQFLVYPAHMPLPEFNDKWKETLIGSGPFKLKQVITDTRIETVRNEGYWKPGLPYLDGVSFHAINDPALVISSWRTGKLDATSLEPSVLVRPILDGVLQKEVGFNPIQIITGAHTLQFIQRTPWTHPKAREAVDLALNRQGYRELAYDGQGNPYASPLIPPENGGQWGLPGSEMKDRPGYRESKTQDLARAKQLLAEAGVDPSKERVRIISAKQNTKDGEVVEANLRDLGFKTELLLMDTGPREEAKRTGNFEISLEALTPALDDPLDYLAPFVITDGGLNAAKWSDPELDRLFDLQDQTLDTAKRADLLRQLQERVMSNRHTVLLIWKATFVGHNKFVRNYPPKLRFLFDSRFRWEQVWLER